MIAFFSLLSFLTTPIDTDETAKVIYKDVTEVDFVVQEVEGNLYKPDTIHITERTKTTFNPLIVLRNDFNSELKHSIDTIR